MPINWFPGHMNSTRQAIKDRVKAGLDVVIELLDARLPGSSSNPLLAALTTGRPALKVLNKQDLADPAVTADWLAHYNAQPHTRAIPLDAGDKSPARALVKACRELAPLRGDMHKPLRVLICGIPNVGKSTVINSLVGRVAAKTGDEPGITKTEQKIILANDFYLFDTPGMLWPRIVVEQSGYCLAASGAVGRNAFDEEEVALELIAMLNRDYPGALTQRFKLGDLAGRSEQEWLAAIGRQRGAVMTGGRINVQKAAEIVLHELRSGSLGRITLETPQDLARWQAEAALKEAERDARKSARSKGSRAATPKVPQSEE